MPVPFVRPHTLIRALLFGAVLLGLSAPMPAMGETAAESFSEAERVFRDSAAGLAADAGTERSHWQRELERVLVTADDMEAARLLYRMGAFAERDGDPARAIARYGESLARDASGRFAHRARTRMRHLEPRMASPALAAFHTGLDEVRRSYLQMDPDEAVATVLTLLDAAPDDPSRALALEWLVIEHAEKREAYDVAWAFALRMAQLDDLPPNLRHRAFHALVHAGYPAGRMPETRRELDRFIRLHPEASDAARLPLLREYALPFGLRPIVEATSWLGLAAFALLFVARRGWRGLAALRDGRWRPWPQLLWLAWLFVGAGLLAESWDHGFLLPFLTFLPLVLLLHLGAGCLGRIPAPAWLRGAQAAAAAWATLGGLYLIVDVYRLHGLFGL